MGRRALLTEEHRAEIRRRYAAGQDGTGPRETFASLARAFGTSTRPIRDAIHGDAYTVRSQGGPAAMAAARAAAETPPEPAPIQGAIPANETGSMASVSNLGQASDVPAAPEMPAADLGALIRDLVAEGGLAEFIRIFWNDPQDFLGNWHIDAICEHLEAVANGEIDRLVINIPPGCMKSLTTGVYWPAWMWTRDPKQSFWYGSFDQSLLNNKQSEPMIQIIQSEEYRAAFPHVRLAQRKPALREFKNTAGGFRFNTSPEGKGTGRHVDYLIVDDPMKPQDAIGARPAAFAKVTNWFDGTLQTRVRKAIVIIMQRVHTDDLAGMCLARGYKSLILPMRMTKRAMWDRDPRTPGSGELLWPSNPKFTEPKVRELEIGLKSEASAQLQQDPTPAAGGFVEEPWCRLEWVEPPARGRWCSSWDFSSKSAETAHSKVAGQLWCATRDLDLVREYLSELEDRLRKIPGANGDFRIRPLVKGETYYCLVDWVGGYWNYVVSKAQFTLTNSRPLWKQHAKVKLIELKANGIPIVEEFKSKFIGIRGVEPEGDKEERLRVHTEKWELGQIIYCPGADPVREEHVKFPRFTWDDQLDATTQALDFLANKNARYRENLAKVAARGGLI